jgi:hypothetical protein
MRNDMNLIQLLKEKLLQSELLYADA